jgi:hypothetical protein
LEYGDEYSGQAINCPVCNDRIQLPAVPFEASKPGLIEGWMQKLRAAKEISARNNPIRSNAEQRMDESVPFSNAKPAMAPPTATRPTKNQSALSCPKTHLSFVACVHLEFHSILGFIVCESKPPSFPMIGRQGRSLPLIVALRPQRTFAARSD